MDFIGPFLPSFSNHYILIAVNYVSKLIKAIALPTNDSIMARKFLKKQIFTRFGTPRAIISDRCAYLINQNMKNLLAKYGFRHKMATAYYP